ncbi:hypothetical protein BSFP_037300 [Burkholderia stabilis]|uniref:DNA-directed RNA polymerase II n=2 Tax=Burkholderia stabilis TaxID=95485 RepID=A0A1Y1BLX6_9BURK|nr:hypothetical protein BSFP_037300 [Burkholderia stabilis]
MPNAPLTVAPRPTAIPDVAVDTTEDWPPIATPFVAAEFAAAVVLPPIAMDPVPVACAPAYEPDTPPLPMATEFTPEAVEKLP